MQFLKQCVAAVTLISLVGVGLVMMAPQPVRGAGGGPDVTVVNVPLPITGTVNATVPGNVNATVTGNVGITGTPTVFAQQSGDWAVGINGDLPPVSLTEGAQVGLAPGTTVGITPSEPWQAFASGVLNDGVQGGEVVLATAPADKWIVIEHCSGQSGLPGTQDPVFAQLFRPGAATWFNPVLQAHYIGTEQYNFNEKVLFYVGPGQMVKYLFTRNFPAPGVGTFFINCAGHFLPA